MKALRHHTDNKWILLYVQRWLTAPMQKRDGSMIPREVGSPQGGKWKAFHLEPYAY